MMEKIGSVSARPQSLLVEWECEGGSLAGKDSIPSSSVGSLGAWGVFSSGAWCAEEGPESRGSVDCGEGCSAGFFTGAGVGATVFCSDILTPLAPRFRSEGHRARGVL